MKKELLIEKALEIREKAYAPYSRFKVGAAILTKKGNIYCGCNVENVSYGLTICAERVAACKAVAAGEKEFSALALVGDLEKATFPCGACLQFLAEFNHEMAIYIYSNKDLLECNLKELLPAAFHFKK